MTIDMFKFVTTNDHVFDAFMCQLFGSEWRWEMPWLEQRQHAKLWMHSYNYGMDQATLKSLLKQQSRRLQAHGR